MITKEKLEVRLIKAKLELDKLFINYTALGGAIAEMEYILAQPDEGEKDGTVPSTGNS